MAKIKGFLIDPEKKEITELPIPGEEKDIQNVINSLWITRGKINDLGDGVYFNDEAMLNTDFSFHTNDMPVPAFYKIEGLRPLAGKSIVIGRDEDGKLRSPSFSLQTLKAMTIFLTEEEAFNNLM